MVNDKVLEEFLEYCRKAGWDLFSATNRLQVCEYIYQYISDNSLTDEEAVAIYTALQLRRIAVCKAYFPMTFGEFNMNDKAFNDKVIAEFIQYRNKAGWEIYRASRRQVRDWIWQYVSDNSLTEKEALVLLNEFFPIQFGEFDMKVTVLVHSHRCGATAYVLEFGDSKIPTNFQDLIKCVPGLAQNFDPESDGIEIFHDEELIRVR